MARLPRALAASRAGRRPHVAIRIVFAAQGNRIALSALHDFGLDALSHDRFVPVAPYLPTRARPQTIPLASGLTGTARSSGVVSQCIENAGDQRQNRPVLFAPRRSNVASKTTLNEPLSHPLYVNSYQTGLAKAFAAIKASHAMRSGSTVFLKAVAAPPPSCTVELASETGAKLSSRIVPRLAVAHGREDPKSPLLVEDFPDDFCREGHFHTDPHSHVFPVPQFRIAKRNGISFDLCNPVFDLVLVLPRLVHGPCELQVLFHPVVPYGEGPA